MTHGPTYYDSKGACIYCGATGERLTDEHILPFSLGGVHVLRQASCLPCADITKKFEQKVARELWGDARTSFNAPTRRKRERKSHIEVPDPHDQTKTMRIPANIYPAGFVFYKMGIAGLLQGLPETIDLMGNWQMVVIDDERRRTDFLKKNPGKLAIRFRHVPREFGQMLAKVGYCQILTSLDPGDFEPICLPYILGTKTNVSHIIGSSLTDEPPEPGIGYRLATTGLVLGERLILIAEVRLYANASTPRYHVVVGEVIGAENITRVLTKIENKDGPLIFERDG